MMRLATIRPYRAALIVALALPACASSTAQQPASTAAPSAVPASELVPSEQVAVACVRALGAADYEGARASFDATMKSALNAEQLKDGWLALLDKLGPFQGLGAPSHASADGYEIVHVPLTFERGTAVARIVTQPPEIAGLFLIDVQPRSR